MGVIILLLEKKQMGMSFSLAQRKELVLGILSERCRFFH